MGKRVNRTNGAFINAPSTTKLMNGIASATMNENKSKKMDIANINLANEEMLAPTLFVSPCDNAGNLDTSKPSTNNVLGWNFLVISMMVALANQMGSRIKVLMGEMLSGMKVDPVLHKTSKTTIPIIIGNAKTPTILDYNLFQTTKNTLNSKKSVKFGNWTNADGGQLMLTEPKAMQQLRNQAVSQLGKFGKKLQKAKDDEVKSKSKPQPKTVAKSLSEIVEKMLKRIEKTDLDKMKFDIDETTKTLRSVKTLLNSIAK